MTQQLMERDAHALPREAPGRPGLAVFAATFSREMTVQDWMICVYFSLMLFAVAIGDGAGRELALPIVGVDIGVLLIGLGLTRGAILTPGSLGHQLVYRMTVFGTVVSSYFQLRLVLAAVSSRVLDGAIYAFDLRVFHFEPSLALDRFVTPGAVEWFAFFYFGYFFILAAHVLPFLLAVKDVDLLARFAIGIFGVFCAGHLLYMLVPGYGPYRYLAGDFHHELVGGTFLRLVHGAVDGVGAQKDIFPSIHTAVPTYFALFSYKHRRRLVFRYSWPVVAFITTQIIGATLFLRWHYLIDLFAGVALASAWVVAGDRIITWETQRREKLGLQPAWVQFKMDEAVGHPGLKSGAASSRY